MKFEHLCKPVHHNTCISSLALSLTKYEKQCLLLVVATVFRLCSFVFRAKDGKRTCYASSLHLQKSCRSVVLLVDGLVLVFLEHIIIAAAV